MDTTIFFSPYLWWPPSTERPACWAHPWPHAPPPGRCSRAVHPDLESAQPLPSIGGDLLWFLVISGDLWRFLVIYDDSWWFLVNSGDFWWFMLISGGLRWFLVISGDLCWFLVISGDLCWFLVIYDDSRWFLVIHANLFWFMGFMVIYGIYIFKMTYANLWWFMVISDWSLMIGCWKYQLSNILNPKTIYLRWIHIHLLGQVGWPYLI